MKNIVSGTMKQVNVEIDEDLKEGTSQYFAELLDSLYDKLLLHECEKQIYNLKPPGEGFDNHWLINAKTRMMDRFSKSVQVEIIEEYDSDNYLCYASGTTVIVKKDKIETGDNHQ